MPTYLWIADDEDMSHDWFRVPDDESAIRMARKLCLPVFDSAHVLEMTFEVRLAGEEDRLVAHIRFRI